MNIEIVIAAYDRSLDWVNLLNNKIKKTIYRKGSHPKEFENEILLENNVGRDVHTFFYHIVKNYENLSDITFFCQDYPFDHFENIIEVLNEKTWEENACVKFDGYYGFHFFSSDYKMYPLHSSEDFDNGKILRSESNGLPHDYINNVNVNPIFVELFEYQPLNRYEFVPGGHFAVTKECVHQHEKKFYENVVKILERDLNAPWNIERLECYIFNSRFNNSKKVIKKSGQN